ncbi:MAG: cyanophycinase [Betaproteobacteria bacterium]
MSESFNRRQTMATLLGLAASGTAGASGTAAGPKPAARAPSAASTGPNSPGPVVALGGSVRFDNPVVWRRLVELAGGPGSRFAVMSMAAGRPERAATLAQQALQRAGARTEWVAVAPALKDQDLAAAVRDPQWLQMVAASQAVFFTGGAQARIVDTLQPGGQDSPLLQAVRALQARGGLVAGTSAGAAIMSQTMFRDAPFVTSVLKGVLRKGVEYAPGLGFAPQGLLIDQHFLKRGRIGRIIPLMLGSGDRLGLGVDEDSAALIHDQEVEVLAGRGALLVELHAAKQGLENGALSLQGARISLLEPGDRFHLETGRLQPSEAKLAAPVGFRAPNFDPTFEFDRYFMDILGDYAIVDAMIQLVDGPKQQVRGLAYTPLSRPGDGRRDLGFEFILTRDEHTRAWAPVGPGGDPYTIERVRLDIRPVRVPLPMLRDWSEPA